MDIEIESLVNLGSYTSSSGFAGHYSLKRAFSKKYAQMAVSQFFEFWGENQDTPISLASNLALSVPLDRLLTDYSYESEDIQKFIIPLLNFGIIHSYDDTSSQFRYFNVSYEECETIEKTSMVVMALGGAVGHVFYILKDIGLLFYPHDDVGFGVISFNSDNQALSRFYKNVDRKKFKIFRKFK